MLRSAASKVMWVGRATVFLVGLAVILALVFGVATSAMGANGKSFLLGKKNVASAISTLVKRGPGPALKLQVGSGQPPLAVNSSARVASLNADSLDGKDSAEFAKAYKSTVVVSPTGTDAENGQALLDALASITDASATKPYLLYVEAGTYDLGNGSLRMKPYVHIEGAGEDNTIITSTVGGCFNDGGTVLGASNAELRLLTVRNTNEGSTSCGTGLSNDSASPRLTQVTVDSTGGANNVGVQNDNSSPTMTNVTANATGGTNNDWGVVNSFSSATIKNSRLSGTTGSLYHYGDDTIGKVAGTQLVGRIGRDSGTLQCFNNYNESMQPVICP